MEVEALNMVDVNYIEYGTNLVRDTHSVEDFSGFLATNGYAIGVVLGLMIVAFFFCLILIFGYRLIKKFFP